MKNSSLENSDHPNAPGNDLPIRAAPHNLDLEQAIIGAALLNNAVVDRIDGLLSDHFFDPLHARLWEIIVGMAGSGRLASAETVGAMTASMPPINDRMTVAQYVRLLTTRAATPVSIKDYAAIVRDLSIRRNLILLAEDVATDAYDVESEGGADGIVKTAESRLFSLGETGTLGTERRFSEALRIAMEQISEAHQNQGGLTGLSTGLVDLDRKMGGMQDSDLIVLAGRPAMGKTSLATNIAVNVAVGGGHVHFFSQEMSGPQIALRVIAERAEIPSDKLRRGEVGEAEWRNLVGRESEWRDLPITIDETGGISLASLSMKARRIKRLRNTRLIVIDYLQLMSGAGKRGENRVQEITTITTGLKALAKELSVPIVVLSQLSRRVEEREDKRPHLSDLRESGSIEQDADVVLFVFREEYYLAMAGGESKGAKNVVMDSGKMEAVAGLAEVIVAKHRHASTGTVKLGFDAALTRFSNLAREIPHGR